MSRIADQVREFHEVYGCDIADSPTVGTESLRALRHALIQEEVDELWDALGAPLLCEAGAVPSITGIADALGDIAYVVFGAALAFGIDLDAVVDEIHRSNLSKLGADGRPIYSDGTDGRPVGKVLKGPNYSPPDLRKVVLG